MIVLRRKILFIAPERLTIMICRGRPGIALFINCGNFNRFNVDPLQIFRRDALVGAGFEVTIDNGVDSLPFFGWQRVQDSPDILNPTGLHWLLLGK